MKKAICCSVVIFLFWYTSCAERSHTLDQMNSEMLDTLFEQFSKFDYGHDAELINRIDEAVKAAQNDERLRKDMERRLVALLESDATLVSKKHTCQKLNIIGSAAAVPALAKQLNNPELAHMARLALERIPDPAVDQALRAALSRVDQELKIGIIYCLGNRRDQQAVDVLLPLTDDSDSATAVAAIYALGKIGTLKASQGLMDKFSKKSDTLHPDVLNAQLRIGESLIKNGKAEDAVKIYQSLSEKDQPDYVRLAGFKGLWDAQPENARKLLYQALAGDNDKMRGLAAQFISEKSPAEDIKYFVNSLEKLQPSGQVALIAALSSLHEETAAPTVREMVKSNNEDVRIAALTALGKIGQSSDVMLLVEIAAAQSGAESGAALQSIMDLEGETVNPTLINNLDKAAADVRVVLIKCLMMRVVLDADEEIIKFINDPDKNVQSAAISATGKIGNETHIPELVALLKKAEDAKEKAGIEKALRSICGRTGEKSSKNILAAYEKADKSLRLRLIDQFSLVGSPEVLEVLRSLVTDEDEDIQHAGIRAISNWPTGEVLADLEHIAKDSENLSHSVLAFRGYIRFVRSLDEPDETKVRRLLRSYSSLVRRPEEANLIFAALGSMRGSIEALKSMERFLYEKDFTEEAIATLLNIANTLDEKYKVDIELALRQILQTTEDQEIIQRVEKIEGKYGIQMESLSKPTISLTEKAKKKIVFIAGPKDHGSVGAHEYPKDLLLFKKCLENSPNIDGITTEFYIRQKPSIEDLKDAAAIIVHGSGDRVSGEYHALFPMNDEDNPEQAYSKEEKEYIRQLDALIKQGMGVIFLHYSLIVANPLSREYMVDWVGGYHRAGYSQVKLDTVATQLAETRHPILNGVEPWFGNEEYYYKQYIPTDNRVTPLILGLLPEFDSRDQVIAWAKQRKDGGRSFVFTGCHYHNLLGQEEDYRQLVLNGIIWAAKIKVPEEGVNSTVPDGWSY